MNTGARGAGSHPELSAERDQAVKIERYRYAARVWAGQTLLAESAACLSVETEGEPSVLYFPQDDIVWSHLRANGSDDAPGGAGTSELWTADGQQVLRLVTEPTVGLDALRAHGTFEPDRVCVEVVDAEPDDRRTRRHAQTFSDLG